MNIVIFGLSITSSWGNGHATTFRALVRELSSRGHRITFLEHDKPWYAAHRDVRHSAYADIQLYDSVFDVQERFGARVAEADAVIVGSYVPQGVALGEWVLRTATGPVAFYDIDTPITLAALERNDCDYLSRELVPAYDIYLSFTGGALLAQLCHSFGARRSAPLYCSVDPALYFPEKTATRWELGYLGTYAADRQPTLDRLLVEPARREPRRRFAVAGPQYPDELAWPANVTRIEHLPPAEHRRFYCEQRFTLNVTRDLMIRAGHSPSVRLFEAAACGVPVISDRWDGIEEFFVPDEEIILADTTEDVQRALNDLSPEGSAAIGERARARVLAAHTAAHRAAELETILLDLRRPETAPMLAS